MRTGILPKSAHFSTSQKMSAAARSKARAAAEQEAVVEERDEEEEGEEEEEEEKREEDEEEEFFVLVDLGTETVTPEQMRAVETCTIVGLETPTPYVAFGGQTYRGTHEEIVGTNLFFRRDAELPPAKRARTTGEDEDEDEEKDGEESDGAGAAGGRADGGSERPPARWPLHAATDRSIRMLPVKLTPRLTVPVKGPAAAS